MMTVPEIDTRFEQTVSIRYHNAAVIGAARSGYSAAKLLKELGLTVLVSDAQSAEKIGPERLAEFTSAGIKVVTSATVETALPYGIDLVVTSPGVKRTADVLQAAVSRGIEVWSEIELAYQISPAKMIAITGTNGKTTSTILTDFILRYAGLESVPAGNISADEIKRTLVDAANQARVELADDLLIAAEISSFQLEWIQEFAPWIGAILNITPDHLNRHATFEEYATSKLRLLENQTADDWALLNYDDTVIRRLELGVGSATRVWISNSMKPDVFGACSFIQDGEMIVDISGGTPQKILSTKEMPSSLPGKHNLFNAQVAATAAVIAGVSPTVVADAIKLFPGVPHRMELVAEVKGIRYINNSMCTNVAAAISSLEAVGRPAILIAGGADKEMEFSPLAKPFKQYAKYVILIGSAADKIEKALVDGGYTQISRAGSMREAVAKASEHAVTGDAIVLSPGCASFDMFKDFEDRGYSFRTEIHSKIIMEGK